jgi:hypothetical protein
MSVKAYAPLGDPTTEYLGPGALYFNFGEAGEAVVGVSKAGGSFTDGAVFRRREGDGDIAAVKNAIDLVRLDPKLIINLLKIDKTNLVKYFAGMALVDTHATYSKVTRKLDLTSSYITNVAYVCQNRDGNDIIYLLPIAIGDGVLEAAFTKDEEIVAKVQFTGCIDPSTFVKTDPDTYPYQIWLVKDGDVAAPTVVVSPLDTATDVAVAADITWTFNEEIDKSCVKASNFFLMKADGTAVAGALTVNTGGTVVTFNPTSNMAANTDHVAICTTAVKDLVGNALAAISVSNFKTIA